MAKKKKQGKVIQLPQTPEAQIRTRARNLEMGDCYINSDWVDSSEASILICKKHKQGGTTFGVFLIDLAIEGLQYTHYAFNMPPLDFETFLDDYLSHGDHEKIEYALAHNIIYGAIEFGEENGFHEPKDFAVSKYILEEDNDEIPLMDIPFGWDDDFDDDDFDDDELDETLFNNMEIGLSSYETRLRAYADLICSLPEITEKNISSEYIDEDDFDDLVDEWEIEDWNNYFTENSKNISLQFLDYMVIFAWEHFDKILDLDHYEHQFNHQWMRRKTRHKKLDELNQLANEAILAGNFDEVPKIYNNCDTFRELFPKSKIVPVTSVVEMCRIYCEYNVQKLDFSEAFSYYMVIQILVWDKYPDEVIESGKKLMASAIREIKSLNLSSQNYPKKKDISFEFPGNETPNLHIWKKFYGLCDEFFALKPWKQLYETDIFGVRLPDSMGDYFVSVMGSNEQAFAVAFYQGQKSLNDFWNLQQELLDMPPESILLISQIMVAWVDRIDLDPKQKKLIKILGLSYRGKNAWPDVHQTVPGYVPFTPSNDSMSQVNTILEQSIDVLKREIKSKNIIDKNRQDKQNYLFRIPDKKGGQTLWHDQNICLQENTDNDFNIYVPKEIIDQFNRLPAKWDEMEININLLPFPITEKNTEGIFPFIMMGVDPKNCRINLMHTVLPKPDFESMTDSLTETIMRKFIDIGHRPEEILISNVYLFPTIEYFNENTMVEASIALELPAHQKAFESMLSDLEKNGRRHY